MRRGGSYGPVRKKERARVPETRGSAAGKGGHAEGHRSASDRGKFSAYLLERRFEAAARESGGPCAGHGGAAGMLAGRSKKKGEACPTARRGEAWKRRRC